MLFIAHRGNIIKPTPRLENKPEYVANALKNGLDTEIDVWFIDGFWFLGHDEPRYHTSKQFLTNHKLWTHAKNLCTLFELLRIKAHCFWHQSDDATLTSKGYMWTFANKPLTKLSIAVLPENSHYQKSELKKCAGICTDFINKYQNILK